MPFSGSPSCICANGVRVDVRHKHGSHFGAKDNTRFTVTALVSWTTFCRRNLPRQHRANNGLGKVDSYTTFDYAFFNIALSATGALSPDLIALRYYCWCRCPRREVWRRVRIEMIYIIHRSWSVRRIYKYVVSLRQLWVCYNKRQLAWRYYSIVATRNSQLCARKNHSRSRSVWQQYHPDLERPHTAVFTFSLDIKQNPTGMCCAECYWNQKIFRTNYRLPGTDVPTKKWNTYFNEKS